VIQSPPVIESQKLSGRWRPGNHQLNQVSSSQPEVIGSHQRTSFWLARPATDRKSMADSL